MIAKIAIGISLLLVVFGAGYLVLSQDNNEVSNIENKAEATNNAPAEPKPTTTGQYIDFTPEALSASSGSRILFFHAPWCPQCRSLDSDIKKSGVPDGVTILKVDYDSNQDLRKKHGVTLQTTTVLVDAQGNTIKKYVPYDNPTLENVKQNLL